MTCQEYRCEDEATHVVAYGKRRFNVCAFDARRVGVGDALTLKNADGTLVGFGSGVLVPVGDR